MKIKNLQYNSNHKSRNGRLLLPLLSIIVMLQSGIALAARTSMKQDSEEKWKYKINVGQFDRLQVLDNVNVVYRNVPDSTGYVVYQGVEDFADSFIFTVNNGQLKIQVTTEDVGKPDLPTLYVYSDFLKSVENSSDFNVTVESVAACPEFKALMVGNGSIVVDGLKCNKVEAVLATGNGSVNLSGETQNERIRLVGTGCIMTDRLKANDVKIRIAGSGTIGCWAINNLNISGLGSTKIYYKGYPSVKKKGGGKVLPLPEGTDIR